MHPTFLRTLVANAPGAFRRWIEKSGFRQDAIEKAIRLASSTGWNTPDERVKRY